MQHRIILFIFALFHAVLAVADNITQIRSSWDPNQNSSEIFPQLDGNVTKIEDALTTEFQADSIKNRIISGGVDTYDDYDYDMLASYSIDDEEGEKTSYYDVGDKARWSFAPAYFVQKCRTTCKDAGKPFSRLLGSRCQCLCPLNAAALGLCDTLGKCDKFCASLSYSRRGDCLLNGNCFCYCKANAPYDVTRVYE